MKHPILLLLLFFCCFWTPAIADDSWEERDIYRDLETFANVLTLIQQYYVDEIDSSKVINGAITGMLGSLDPHSAYMTPEDFKDMEDETSGSFTGIGIEISMRDGMLTAVAPIEGTPADRQGIKSGDQIVRINGELTKTMTLLEAVKETARRKRDAGDHHRSSPGMESAPGPDPDPGGHPFDLGQIRMELEPGFAYIRISNFQATTTKDVRNALKNMQKKRPSRAQSSICATIPGVA
jgi:carboxyl-terminal processing protease